MVIKLMVSQTRLHPLISLWPPFLLWIQGAKGHVIDAASIICLEKAGHWQSSLRVPFSVAALNECPTVPLCGLSVEGLTVTSNATRGEFTILILPPSKSGSDVRCLIAGPVRHRHCK